MRPCLGSLRGLLGAPEVSSTDSIPIGFCRQELWGLISLALETWAEGPGVGLGLLAPEKALPYFYPPHVGVGPACSTSTPPTSLDGCNFFNSVVVGLPFNSIYDGSG